VGMNAVAALATGRVTRPVALKRFHGFSRSMSLDFSMYLGIYLFLRYSSQRKNNRSDASF
jgi:hypothetical protein